MLPYWMLLVKQTNLFGFLMQINRRQFIKSGFIYFFKLINRSINQYNINHFLFLNCNETIGIKIIFLINVMRWGLSALLSLKHDLQNMENDPGGFLNKLRINQGWLTQTIYNYHYYRFH